MSNATDLPRTVRRAARDSAEPFVGGVASGLARHLGLPVLWVRAAFVLMATMGGMGIALYAALWVFLPSDASFETSAPGLESASRTGKRPRRVPRLTDVGPAIALGALGFGVMLVVEAFFGRGALFWPVVIGLAGIALLWRQADEVQRERWLDTTGRIDWYRAVFGTGGWASYVRIAAGLTLVISAFAAFALTSGQVGAARDVVVAGLLGIVGVALVIGPWMVRLVGDLGAERAERVRTQERADMAAHLHDSVLQTLALIQRNADDGATVARLARAQERDLRSWLYAGESTDATTLAGALREMAARAEDEYVVVVDVVAVGDLVVHDSIRPLVHATREAVTNAAKHAGTGRVDIYAEVLDDAVEVFVRDRGVGFDPAAVPDDRLGVRNSIIDRMTRHGGTAVIDSSPGNGTNVRLRMPRTARGEHDV
ncbi:PspC domain-containing protein [Nocardioides sp. LHG3406-4]|uniref:ATP-binding protein n=1 Tax=Nocardioides sp. LHG3406-4 TaxID=2804575 RepID=UPI003CF5424B